MNHRRVARITEREIPNSSGAMSVTNLGFVGEGVGVTVVAWTHLKGSVVGEGSLRQSLIEFKDS